VIGFEVQLDSAAAREGLAAVSGKQFYKTILRGTDAVVGLLLERMKRKLKNLEPPWFKRRAVGIMNDFWRWARRLKAWPTTMDTITATALTQTRYAAAIEDGGEYDQWVKDYHRRATSAWGRPVKHPREIPVRGHHRTRREWAMHYFAWTVSTSESDFGKPMERALEILVNERRVATQAEMKKGLPR
jgi:hypothetical protein